ncbi:MAG TPA: nuclear transport factor 2 family protein [Terriglobales bacterium]|nr:nuclear transport factor 2 family protein [Terriglobales bacterium]
MKSLLLVTLLLLAGIVCAQESTKTEAKEKPMHGHTAASASFKGEVQKMADEWKADFQAKDADKVASRYADDAVFINAEGTFHGSSDIKNEIKRMIDRGDTVDSIVTMKALQGGNIAYAEGTYSGKTPNASGAEGQGQGNWVVTLKNSNGKWLLATHTSVPAVGMKHAVMPAKSK